MCYNIFQAPDITTFVFMLLKINSFILQSLTSVRVLQSSMNIKTNYTKIVISLQQTLELPFLKHTCEFKVLFLNLLPQILLLIRELFCEHYFEANCGQYYKSEHFHILFFFE